MINVVGVKYCHVKLNIKIMADRRHDKLNRVILVDCMYNTLNSNIFADMPQPNSEIMADCRHDPTK